MNNETIVLLENLKKSIEVVLAALAVEVSTAKRVTKKNEDPNLSLSELEDALGQGSVRLDNQN